MSLLLKSEPDGFGFFYGTLDVGAEAPARIDLMPPAPLWRGTSRLESLPDAMLWVAHVDGEEIGRCKTYEDAIAMIREHGRALREGGMTR